MPFRYFPTSTEIKRIIREEPGEPVFVDEKQRLYGFNRGAPEQLFYDSGEIDNLHGFTLWALRGKKALGYPLPEDGPIPLFRWEDGEFNPDRPLGTINTTRQLAGSSTRNAASNGIIVKTDGWMAPFYKQSV